MDYCIVLTTTATQEEADKIANVLLESRLAACVQTHPVTSSYLWKGKIERADEIRLIIKIRDCFYLRTESLIKENHSYKVPQIVKLLVTAGLPEYLDWIAEETKSK
jgi:periplasmic divalent cation tolerance protein